MGYFVPILEAGELHTRPKIALIKFILVSVRVPIGREILNGPGIDAPLPVLLRVIFVIRTLQLQDS